MIRVQDTPNKENQACSSLNFSQSSLLAQTIWPYQSEASLLVDSNIPYLITTIHKRIKLLENN